MQKDGVLQMERQRFYFITSLKTYIYTDRLWMSKKEFMIFVGEDLASFGRKDLLALL